MNFKPRGIAVDGRANTYVVGDEPTPNADGTTDANIGLYKLSPVFDQALGLSLGGSKYDSTSAMGLDADGNVYITGTTQSQDFPVVHPVQAALNGSSDAFLMKLDPQGNVVFSTYFGGSGAETGDVLSVDKYGTVFVGGRTGSADFPASPNAYASAVVTPNAANPVTTKFVFKIATAGAKLVFATTLGGRASGPEGFADLAPGAGGDLYALLAPGASTPGMGSSTPRQGLVRLSADGSQVPYSTDIGSTESDTFSAMGTELNGNLILAGSKEFLQWDASSNQAVKRSAAKIGKSPTIAIDYSGDVVVHGTGSAGRPITYFGFRQGNEFVTKFHGIGPKINFGSDMPDGTADVAVAVGPYRDIHLLGSSGLVSRLIPDGEEVTLPKIMGVASAAGYMVSANVAPGEIVSLYGPKIGSPTAANGQIDGSGQLSTNLEGVQVLFNGTPGNMLYTSQTQINVVAPFDLGNSASVLVEVQQEDKTWTSTNLHRVDAAPGVFPIDYTSAAAAALNQDSTVNSSTSRARPGSMVTVYLTGAGEMQGASYKDGQVFDATTPIANLPSPKLPVTVSYQGTSLPVEYYGQAPEDVAGVVQLNFHVPASAPANSGLMMFNLTVGDASATPFGIWVEGAQ